LGGPGGHTGSVSRPELKMYKSNLHSGHLFLYITGEVHHLGRNKIYSCLSLFFSGDGRAREFFKSVFQIGVFSEEKRVLHHSYVF
jgi:hypothetical protein